MIHTIIEPHSVIPLDSRFNPLEGTTNAAFAQLEIYHTDKSPVHNVGVINAYNKKFTYKIGDEIDVINRITVSPSIWLGNAVMTPFLQQYIENERRNSL